MAFKKGHQKFGGKQKGVPNKTSKSLIEKLNDLGMSESLDHPVIWMFKVAHGLVEFDVSVDGVALGQVKADANQRIQCMKEVAKYVSPQLKAIEHSGDLAVQVTEIRETVIDPAA
jgi:hypothetical protein